MEKEFGSMDEYDPKAMTRMMRKMPELTGKMEGQFEEVVRKLERGYSEDVEGELGPLPEGESPATWSAAAWGSIPTCRR